jgi:TfoX/Sxy family transcriptional regulator of competence genes
MFGGVTFLLNGNMLCCASSKGLMVRVGAAAERGALESPHASPCMGTGRPMAGFIMIEHRGIARNNDLARWVEKARAYVETLPAKTKPNRKAKSTS